MPDEKPDEGSPAGRKAVGIYDRPASADRSRHRNLLIAIVVIAIALSILFWFLRR